MDESKDGENLEEDIEMSIAEETEPESENQETFLYFDDGKRRIDCVLAYSTSHIKGLDEDDSSKKCFSVYLDSLKQMGLQLESTDNSIDCSDNANEESVEVKNEETFIKIHAPMKVLYESAEELKMKMKTTKVKKEDMITWYEGMVNEGLMRFIRKIDLSRLRHPTTKKTSKYYVAPFLRERLDEFADFDKPDVFFTPAERGRLVYFILQKTKFGTGKTEIGIDNLIHKNIFLDAYPQHDGPTLRSMDKEPKNERQRLQKDWATARCLFKYQPIDAIKEYFGEKIALYFSFLGFYTAFLIPAAIVGILCFIYGVVTGIEAPDVLESCSDPLEGNGTGRLFYMCPLCDKRCPYFKLNENCIYTEVTRYFDNEATFFLSVFMCVWATLFIQYWKRSEITLAHKWHSIGYERTEEQVRPEYIAKNFTPKLNPVTREKEPRMSKAGKVRRLLGTFGVAAFFVLLVIGAVAGVVVFRAAFSVALLASNSIQDRQGSKIIVSVAAGFINLIAINILKQIYNRIAIKLTDFECPRTLTEYEDSFTVKMFLFQFVNTYSSIVYVAFFKSEQITGTPGNYKRFTNLRFRMDGCAAQGCFLELTIQLVIIMVGQQFINNLLETVIPMLLKWKRKRSERKIVEALQNEGIEVVQRPQWEDDFKCQMVTKFSLFWEYLEMVLQYGFVTMFVAGLPLAPLFALLNNIIEIRVDAYNYVGTSRRPVAQRAEDIGAWYNILVALTSLSVVINAFVLAFTSQLIPSLVYKHSFSDNNDMHGYVNWTLSYFNVEHFTNESRPLNSTIGGFPTQHQCRYPGFREPFYPYDPNLKYYMVLAARLAFVLCFIVFVLIASWIISWLINDVPSSLKITMQREKLLASDLDKKHKNKVEQRTFEGTIADGSAADNEELASTDGGDDEQDLT